MIILMATLWHEAYCDTFKVLFKWPPRSRSCTALDWVRRIVRGKACFQRPPIPSKRSDAFSGVFTPRDPSKVMDLHPPFAEARRISYLNLVNDCVQPPVQTFSRSFSRPLGGSRNQSMRREQEKGRRKMIKFIST